METIAQIIAILIIIVMCIINIIKTTIDAKNADKMSKMLDDILAIHEQGRIILLEREIDEHLIRARERLNEIIRTHESEVSDKKVSE
jgi:hypothetical protein